MVLGVLFLVSVAFVFKAPLGAKLVMSDILLSPSAAFVFKHHFIVLPFENWLCWVSSNSSIFFLLNSEFFSESNYGLAKIL